MHFLTSKNRLKHFIFLIYIFSATLNRDSPGRYTFPFASLGNGESNKCFSYDDGTEEAYFREPLLFAVTVCFLFRLTQMWNGNFLAQ